MKVLQIVLTIAVIGLAIAFFTMERPQKGAGAETESAADAKLASIEKSMTELAAAVKGLQEKADRAAEPATRISQADIDMAVARALDARATEKLFDESITGGAGTKAGAATPASKTKIDVRAALETLLSSTTVWDDKEELWRKIRDAGMMDEVLEAFEERAGDNPSNADMQAELGYAYLQKLQTVPEGPEKGTWAMKADSKFDQALKLDDHNWQARFLKATSLAFWPPVFGKQPEAIKHFEVLVQQQEKKAPKDDFVQTYVFLGNLYSQQGKMEKAQDVWKKGLALFPDNDELKKQVATAESK